ncbi:uncharacterized protein KGF55_002497 [Candida pseudojiufengensis]|uniref:uncharacterized protein n=1 Tax=Candida pseudojiufengensis TaxID=497109 RepID=UPI0022247B7A|nr:uncharacterized protein KGF55_002497 [Candida pseudojiufengensis]KAI5963617.1 hypothetical protein KGF55_002497 [Candida pseudojiufengensis]
MSSTRRIKGYMEHKDALVNQYKQLKESFKDEQEREIYENLFHILLKLDELVYEYNVIKSYLQSKQDNTPKNKILLEQIQTKINDIESSIYLDDLFQVEPKLTIYRKELSENAQEGGKIISGFEQQNPNLTRKFLDDRVFELRKSI